MAHNPDDSVCKPSPESPTLRSALLSTLDEMVKCLFEKGYQETLALACERFRGPDLIFCEACAVFSIDPHAPHQLILKAHHCDRLGAEFDPVTLAARSIRGGGLTAYLVHQCRPIRLHGSELMNHPYLASDIVHDPAPYLNAPQQSILSVPVLDQRSRVVALVKFSNRKESSGRTAADGYFTRDDEEIASIFCNILALVFNSYGTLRGYRDILRAASGGSGQSNVLENILQAGAVILGADRGDIALWDNTRSQLVLAAATGETKLVLHEKVPPDSFVHSVYANGSALSSEVSTAAAYYPASVDTRSEAASLIRIGSRNLGVLNFESSKRNNFRKPDMEVLDDLSTYAALALKADVSGSDVAHIARYFAETYADPGRKELELVLGKTIEDTDLSAILYFANDADRMLESKAALRVGGEDSGFNPRDIRYPYSSSSFASKVRRARKACFSFDPYDDPDVEQTIARKCGVEGPMLGLPLIAPSGDVVGILVAWKRNHGRTYWQTEEERERTLSQLNSRAPLWACLMLPFETLRRNRAVLQEIGRINLATVADLESRLHRIGSALLADGFDRVRLFRWNAKLGQFEGWLSWGMSNPERFPGIVISPTNPYACYTAKRAVADPSAYLFDPTGANRLAVSLPKVPDPDAAKTEKNPTASWAVVPIVFNGNLKGQIAADTERSKRSIGAEHLEYMTVIGAIAAQIIVSDEMVEQETRSRVEKVAEQVLEVILHTIKTPVHSIVGIADRLWRTEGVAVTEQAKHWTGRLATQIDWLERLMNETNVFVDCMSRYKVRDESLAEVLSAAIAGVQPLADKKKVKLTLAAPAGNACPFTGDRDMIQIIVQNLLDNAIKHSPKGKRVQVHVAADPENSVYVVSVLDEGPGIPESEIKNLLHEEGLGLPRITNPEGRGLGLAIAQTMALRAGGNLKYMPREESNGALFLLSIPFRGLR
ncbi:MAG: ATP-binding protein [Candidatus Solibacter sp.]